MATWAPSRTSLPRPASASSASSSPTTARISADGVSGLHEVVALIRKIQRRLEPGGELEQRRIDLADASGEGALELIERGARLERGDRLDEILHRLRLDEVEPAVEVRAKRELTWFREPRARLHCRARQSRAAARGCRAR